jgi:hypothetical protein
MSRATKIVLAVVVVALVAVGGFFAFEYFDHHEKVKDAERDCTSALTTPVAGAALPSSLAGFTLPSDQKLLEVDTQGKTVVVYAITSGSRKDLVSLRDKVVDAMKAQSFTAAATDQEPTYEAEGEFSGKLKGTIQVQPQCEGYDRIRYKFNL